LKLIFDIRSFQWCNRRTAISGQLSCDPLQHPAVGSRTGENPAVGMCVNIDETRAKVQSRRLDNTSALLAGNVTYSSDCVTGYANVTSPGRSACTI
jgi:hypothetical protein